MNDPFDRTWSGYFRKEGSKGIRNIILVIYTVMCSKHVVEAIAQGEKDVHVIGFPGCYDNQYAVRMLLSMARHPNVGGVLTVGLGCEYTQPRRIADLVNQSGRLADAFYIQDEGGTTSSVAKGKTIIRKMRERLDRETERVEMSLTDMVIGCECGGSDGTSGLVGNPVVGRLFDQLVDHGGTAIIEEIVEMIGLKEIILSRAATPQAKEQLETAYDKAVGYCQAVQQYSVSPGNFAGGLTTIEEKSMGAFAKSGSQPIHGVIKVGQRPPYPGLWILDSVPDDHFMAFGYTNPNDTEGLMDLISAGSQLVLFVTGRGSVIGSAVSPLLKITGNSKTYACMEEDMDFNAGTVLLGELSLDEAATALAHQICDTAAGVPTKPERLGHQEYFVMYKYQNLASGTGGCRL